MKITAIHGQMHKGSTYNISRLFLDSIADEDTEISEFFLPEDGPHYCIGCFTCFIKGEDKCPHARMVQPIAREIEDAHLLILDSPCYVFGMSGQMKALLDHLAYRWMAHRPHPMMFRKVGLVISTAAGAGAGKVTKGIRQNLFHWGVPKIYRYSRNVGAMNWDKVKRKETIEGDVQRISRRIKRNIGRVKPGLKTQTLFSIMRMNQRSNDWNPVDRDHWHKEGWLESKRPW